MRRQAWAALAGAVVLGASTAGAGEPGEAAVAGPQDEYVEQLVARARQLSLAEQELWRRLVHYRKRPTGSWLSEADSPHFFMAQDGKSNPQAELEATLRGFFGPDPVEKDLQHPYCRFPARLAWLNAMLSFDFNRMPRRSCEGFQTFYRELRPRSVTMVFSSYYLNNPASAFGHTFLRINKYGRPEGDEGLELLDYGIDYSANVDTDNAFVYGLKGLLGMFPGQFRRVPYYLKVREYNDFESRDLWEYELNLSHEELSMAVAHLWEMGSNYYDYFYLSENCSYHVLAVLEVANPRLQLLKHVGYPVIPADTIKAIHAQPGFVRSVRYRPSNRTQFKARIASMSEAELDMLDVLGQNPLAAFPVQFTPEQQVKVLDAAIDLFDYRYARDLVREPGEEENTEAAMLKQKLLERRASLLLASEDLVVEPPFRKMPHLGHGSFRLGLGSGYLDDRGAYYTLRLRLALHDLADASSGYPDYASIEFLPMALRYYPEEAKVSLEDMSLVRVLSLNPLSRFEKRLSWTVRAGGTRIRDEGCDGCFAALGEFGAGYAVSPATDTLDVWGLADARLLSPVEGGLVDAIRAGVGGAGGARLRLGETATLMGEGHWLYLPTQDPWHTWGVDTSLRVHYRQNFALSLESRVQPNAWSAEAVSVMYF